MRTSILALLVSVIVSLPCASSAQEARPKSADDTLLTSRMKELKNDIEREFANVDQQISSLAKTEAREKAISNVKKKVDGQRWRIVAKIVDVSKETVPLGDRFFISLEEPFEYARLERVGAASSRTYATGGLTRSTLKILVKEEVARSFQPGQTVAMEGVVVVPERSMPVDNDYSLSARATDPKTKAPILMPYPAKRLLTVIPPMDSGHNYFDIWLKDWTITEYKADVRTGGRGQPGR